jgi:hypothetical protein
VISKRQVSQFVKRDFAPTWRWMANPGPSREFLTTPPVVSGEARRVVGSLRADGLAMTSVPALTGSPELFEEVLGEAHDLMDSQREDIDRRRRVLAGQEPAESLQNGSVQKPYLVELMGTPTVEVTGREALLRLATSPQFLAVASSYYRMAVRVGDVNIWLNLATDEAPRSSTLWHRDLPEDYRILKAFVYLRDVTRGNGAIEYVPGTHAGRARRDVLPTTYDGVGNRFDADQLEAYYPADARRQAEGTAGTVVWADTRGIHRGGWAREQDRLLGQILYVSNASRRSTVLRWGPEPDPLALRAIGDRVRAAHRPVRPADGVPV